MADIEHMPLQPLLRIVRWRCLAVVVVAPARNASVFPQPTGVKSASGYCREPLVFRRLSPAGVEWKLHSLRIYADTWPAPG